MLCNILIYPKAVHVANLLYMYYILLLVYLLGVAILLLLVALNVATVHSTPRS